MRDNDRWYDRPGQEVSAEITFEALADSLPIMIFRQDASGAVTYANNAWYESTRLARDPFSFTAQAWADVVHPDDLERVLRTMSAAIPARSSYEFEYRVKPADAGDDAYRWYVARGTPQALAGRFDGWLGSVYDIDDARKRVDAERALREEADRRERELRSFAEAIPVIAWRADENGWIEWYNGRWFEYTGQTEKEATGWGWQAAHHPDDFLEVMKQWPHSIATGEPFEMEFRLRRFDGSFQWFVTRVQPVRDETGSVVRWYGTNVDINAQKMVVERTKRVAQTLQEVFLPKELPRLEGMRLDAVYLPAERDALVGGDWFDAFVLSDGRLAFSIGDVAGHGLEASIIVGRVRQAIFTLAFRMQDPAAILKELDAILASQDPDILVTALVGFIDPSRTAVTYATAGHPPPMMAYPGDKMARVLEGGDPPLGLHFPGALRTFEAPISPDAVLAVYTDGITEFARDAIAAERKLQAAVALMVGNRTVARPAAAVQEIVLADMPAKDDAALLLMLFTDAAGPEIGSDAGRLKKSWRFHSSDAHSAHTARREIVAYLREIAPSQDLSDSELIIGEILANTVEHAPGLVEVQAEWFSERPVVVVRDTGPGIRRLAPNLPNDLLDENGRGIFLIASLAHTVDVQPIPGYGTEIRVVLPLERA